MGLIRRPETRRRPGGLGLLLLPILLSLLVGAAIAALASPRSLWPLAGVGSAASTKLATTQPPPRRMGVLGPDPRLYATTDGVLVAGDDRQPLDSTDHGATWRPIPVPPGANGLSVDEADWRQMIVGGARVLHSEDGGASWRLPAAAPPGRGPYTPLMISPTDDRIWFFLHQGQLARTQDGSHTWSNLAGLPPLNTGLMAAGAAAGQFYLASGPHVFELDGNGQQVVDRGALPDAATVIDLAVAAGTPSLLMARGSDGRSFLSNGTIWVASGAGLGGPVEARPSGGNLLVGDGTARLGTGAIAVSVDGGVTWDRAQGLPAMESVQAIAAGTNSLYAYCYGGDLYTSTDDGQTWTLASSALRAPA